MSLRLHGTTQLLEEEYSLNLILEHFPKMFSLKYDKNKSSSLYKPGVAQSVPGGLDSKIFMIFGA